MRISLLGMFGEWCLGTDVLNFVMVEHPVAYASNQVSFSWGVSPGDWLLFTQGVFYDGRAIFGIHARSLVSTHGPQQSICFLGSTCLDSRSPHFMMVEHL